MMKKKGVALLLALFTLLIISLLLVAFLETTAIDLQIVNNQLARNQALYIADAGVEYAISRLKNSKSNFAQLIYFPSGLGSTYDVTYSNSSGIINSTATLASGVKVGLEAKVSVAGAAAPYSVKITRWREP